MNKCYHLAKADLLKIIQEYFERRRGENIKDIQFDIKGSSSSNNWGQGESRPYLNEVIAYLAEEK